jgi:prepilin-type N-terminal cleavage/methylation domain-containing protein
MCRRQNHNRAFSLMETLVSLVIILILLAILVPSLSSARVNSRRETCRENQKFIFEAFETYLKDNDGQFPGLPSTAAWSWGGVRFGAADVPAGLDDERPINAYLPFPKADVRSLHVCRCPADCGITDPASGAGTGSRSAFRAYGTSFRANALLFDAAKNYMIEMPADAPVRGLTLGEIKTAPSRMLMLGDPIWFEIAESTGRDADWHASPRQGNLTFLDGSVRFMELYPKTIQRGIVLDPRMPGSFGPETVDAEPTE